MDRRRQIGEEVSARGHKEPGLRDGRDGWWLIGHRFLSKRPPLAVREQRAIDGLSSNEYHGAQPATLLCSAMWVSLSPGVSAPDWGVFFLDVRVLFYHTCIFLATGGDTLRHSPAADNVGPQTVVFSLCWRTGMLQTGMEFEPERKTAVGRRPPTETDIASEGLAACCASPTLPAGSTPLGVA